MEKTTRDFIIKTIQSDMSVLEKSEVITRAIECVDWEDYRPEAFREALILVMELSPERKKMNNQVGILIVIGCMVLGGLSIGAYLVVKGYPWFALLVFVLVALMRYEHED